MTKKSDTSDNSSSDNSRVVNAGTLAIVFFWVGLWGAITVICEWLFTQLGCFNNPGSQFLIYMLIAVAAAYVILTYVGDLLPFLNDDNSKEKLNKTNKNKKF